MNEAPRKTPMGQDQEGMLEHSTVKEKVERPTRKLNLKKVFENFNTGFKEILCDGRAKCCDKHIKRSSQSRACAASVVVSCKIPILATRVRFPGGALLLV